MLWLTARPVAELKGAMAMAGRYGIFTVFLRVVNAVNCSGRQVKTLVRPCHCDNGGWLEILR